MKRMMHAGKATLALMAWLGAGLAWAQSQQAAVDPASGKLRAPTLEERAALSAAQKSIDAKQAALLRAGGAQRPATEADALKTLRTSRRGKAIIVPESLTSSLVAEKSADGRLHIQHQGDAPAHAAAAEATQ